MQLWEEVLMHPDPMGQTLWLAKVVEGDLLLLGKMLDLEEEKDEMQRHLDAWIWVHPIWEGPPVHSVP